MYFENKWLRFFNQPTNQTYFDPLYGFNNLSKAVICRYLIVEHVRFAARRSCIYMNKRDGYSNAKDKPHN